MKIVTFSLFVLFTSLNLSLNMHPVHISIINVDYNESEKVFNMSVKLFADDFEKIINKQNNVQLNLGQINELTNCNSLIDKYIKHHLILKINNKNLIKKIMLSHKEVKNDENSVWLYYRIKFSSSKSFKNKKVEVVNILMNDLYKDQKNLFIFTYFNTKEGFNFGKNKTNFEFLIK